MQSMYSWISKKGLVSISDKNTIFFKLTAIQHASSFELNPFRDFAFFFNQLITCLTFQMNRDSS